MKFKKSLNMKKKFGILLALFHLTFFCHLYAQDGYSKKIDSLQSEYFTKELALTADESDQFWPVYNNYRVEIKNARKEAESDPIALEEKILNIRKKYKTDFKKILEGDDRVNKVYLLDKSFRDMLREELLKRQSKGEADKDADN
jgi:hypothetical protein